MELDEKAESLLLIRGRSDEEQFHSTTILWLAEWMFPQHDCRDCSRRELF